MTFIIEIGTVRKVQQLTIPLLVVLTILLSGCQSLFFWPSKDLVDSPGHFNFEREIVLFNSMDGIQLHGWYLTAKQTSQIPVPKGTVYFLHGNAQNLSYHISSLYWLTDHGWNVFIIDYRGYGRSQGEPDFKSVIDDATAGYYWLKNNKDSQDNIIVLGQSLGGAIAVGMLGLHQDIDVNGLIIDSTFTSHRKVFRELLGKSWLLWTFQYPLSMGLPDDYAPEKFIAKLSNIPTLLVHSEADRVIDKQHSVDLFNLSQAKKGLWLADGIRHGQIWQEQEWQQKLVCQLEQWPAFKAAERVCSEEQHNLELLSN
ncbi:alpha/beta hydrolase [Thalassotalea sp. ND16A]|uniref:alpha/beta hydrolase n=1 Tax=Thalassotalea sp. ND16A TaxID=1535422 RepID=UPI00051D2377|nr:alpha/beta fold hydrolase [Thalassotalea sp. ND16A]KGJ96689.1 hypothetical protein ND16A_1042 [Thalassotalea sp. ND16A]